MIFDVNTKAKIIWPGARLLATALMLMVLTPLAGAQEEFISIAARADKDTITIGDRLIYTLTITHAPQITIQPPDPGVDLGSFEIRDFWVLPGEKLEDGRLQDQFAWEMTTFSTGELEISPVRIVYLDSSGVADTLASPPMAVAVKSLLNDKASDIRDIKPPASMPRGLAWRYWALGVTILLAAAFIYLRHLRKKLLRRDLEAIDYQGPPRPAHEIAFEELDRIAVLNLLGRGLIKQFYTEISEAIKRYIARRYVIQTMELTTSELYAQMHSSDVPEEHIQAYMPFFQECDLVKFAKHIPPQEKIDSALDKARQLVFSTMRKPSTVAEPEAEVASST
jgi:hypothetical protein